MLTWKISESSQKAQIKVFRGPRLPKQQFKAQKSEIELKMSKNGFRLDASEWENVALRTAPALIARWILWSLHWSSPETPFGATCMRRKFRVISPETFSTSKSGQSPMAAGNMRSQASGERPKAC